MQHTPNRLLASVMPPASEPITLDEAKLYLRVDSDDEDALIGDLIVSARVSAEQWLKRSLISQTWKIAYASWPLVSEIITLPMGPVNSIVSATIVNLDSSVETLDPSSYWLNAAHNEIVFYAVSFLGSVVGSHVEITYNAGYGTASDVPKPIKLGMLAHIVSMYENRGDTTGESLPVQSTQLYTPFREVRL